MSLHISKSICTNSTGFRSFNLVFDFLIVLFHVPPVGGAFFSWVLWARFQRCLILSKFFSTLIKDLIPSSTFRWRIIISESMHTILTGFGSITFFNSLYNSYLEFYGQNFNGICFFQNYLTIVLRFSGGCTGRLLYDAVGSRDRPQKVILKEMRLNGDF